MWKTIYIASDITLANSLKNKLKKKGIKTILNILDMEKEELNGNVEILVLKSESIEALNLISEIIICENN
jgi:uncharacterized protein YgbK (DUF1537 family)